jgi:hypothetical protein
MLCFSTAYIVPQAERFFSSREDVVVFRRFMINSIANSYIKRFHAPLDMGRTCPVAKAVVLHRVEGLGHRDVLNYDVIDRVLHKHGIHTYHNISIGSDTNSLDQMQVFGNFGLMISSHSSQLKNLAFAADHAIVLETKAELYSRAFSEGSEHLNIIYIHSVGHDPYLADINNNMYVHSNYAKAVVSSPYYLDEHVLDVDVGRALDLQRQKCGDIWGKP